MRSLFVALLIVGAGVTWFAAASHATRAAAPAAVPGEDAHGAGDRPPAGATVAEDLPQGGGSSLLSIVRSMGMTGLLILALLMGLSIAATALAIEHMFSIRAGVLVPEGLAEQVRQHLADGRLAAADQLCIRYPSFLASVLRAGFAEVDGGWTAVEKGMEDALAQQSARLFRKIEYLSVIGNLAPMLGLLGTVTGMIFAFQEVAAAEGAARAAQLAEGIYTALITTVGGLLVAIPSLAAFAVFRNRVDQLVADVAYLAHHAILPIKRATLKRGASRVALRNAAGDA